MRKTRTVSLVLVPILLAGCGAEVPEEAQQRDVYTKFEDCMADWGKSELCQQMQEADAKKFAEATTGVSGGGGSHVVYWGPSYYPGSRSVSYGEQTYAPLGNRAMSRPFAVTSQSSALAKSSPGKASPSVARGGFGSGGRAAGAGASSGG